MYTPIQSYKVYGLCTTENINCCLCPSLSCLNALAKALFYKQYDHMSDLNGQKHISTELLVVDWLMDQLEERIQGKCCLIS